MNVQIEIPRELFDAKSRDISREILEAVAVDGFRSGQLGTGQIMRLLGFETRDEAHKFLAAHKIPWVDYSVEDISRESELLTELLP
jgi:predicted HTH domain antitoxin